MEFDKSRIERLKRSLYSRDESLVPKEKRTPVREEEFSTPKNWGEDHSFEFPTEEMSKKNNSFFNKFFAFSLLFFVISVGLAGFIFFGGLNLISSNNVDIKVVGPSTVASGEELDFVVSVVNQNRVDLDGVTLSLEYPEGTRLAGDNGGSIVRDKIDLGTLEKGRTKDSSFRVSVFGEKDSIRPIVLKVNYRVSGSNAVFSKEKTYEIVINSSPVLLKVNYPKEVNSGQPITFSLDVTSNSIVPVENTLVKIEYPYGFSYKESSLKPVKDDSVWNLGTMKDGDKKTLKVTGVLIGQDLEDRSFRISVGSQSNSIGEFDTDLAVEQATVGIRKSFFNLGVKPSSEFYNVGETAFMDVSWQNTLPEKLSNNRIEVVLSGNMFDRNGVSAVTGGYYRSLDNSIIWDKNTTPLFGELASGSSGKVSFSVKSLSDISNIKNVKNPHIDMKVTMLGDRSNSGETISSTEDISVKFSTLLNLTSRVYRSFAGMQNSGPIPPRADVESTYTISWTLTNTINDTSDVFVSAQLPVYVSWKGETSPNTESISYDPSTRKVTWNVSNVSFGTGFIYSPKQVSFKVGLTPSINQVGSSPEILFPSTVSGKDLYTGKSLSGGTPSVNTLFSDLSFKVGDEKVVN